MAKRLAHYECMKCKKHWLGAPGPVECIYCGYFEDIKWHNYRRFMRPGQ